MDGLGRAIGDALSGLIGGAIDAVGAAIDGVVASLGSAIPAGLLPVLGIAAVIVVGWLLLRR